MEVRPLVPLSGTTAGAGTVTQDSFEEWVRGFSPSILTPLTVPMSAP